MNGLIPYGKRVDMHVEDLTYLYFCVWGTSCVIQDDAQRADSFASLVLLSTFQQEHSPTTSLTLQLLNQALLRSANFYETECFHGKNLSVCIPFLTSLSFSL